MNVYVVRAFVQLREIIANHRELVSQLNGFEEKTKRLAMKQETFVTNTRAQLKQMFDAI